MSLHLPFVIVAKGEFSFVPSLLIMQVGLNFTVEFHRFSTWVKFFTYLVIRASEMFCFSFVNMAIIVLMEGSPFVTMMEIGIPPQYAYLVSNSNKICCDVTLNPLPVTCTLILHPDLAGSLIKIKSWIQFAYVMGHYQHINQKIWRMLWSYFDGPFVYM